MKTPSVPARTAVGICTSSHACKPTSQEIVPIASARTRFVTRMLRR